MCSGSIQFACCISPWRLANTVTTRQKQRRQCSYVISMRHRFIFPKDLTRTTLRSNLPTVLLSSPPGPCPEGFFMVFSKREQRYTCGCPPGFLLVAAVNRCIRARTHCRHCVENLYRWPADGQYYRVGGGRVCAWQEVMSGQAVAIGMCCFPLDGPEILKPVLSIHN